MAEGSDDKDSRTLEASAHKLRQAREKGQVPISREIGQLVSNLMMIAGLVFVINRDVAGAALALSDLFEAPILMAIGEGSAGMGDLLRFAMLCVLPSAVMVAKILLLFLVGGVISGLLQGPFVVASERIKIKGNKISPMSGIKRLLGKENLVEFLKNLVKLSLLCSLTIYLVWGRLWEMLPGALTLPDRAVAILADDALMLLFWVALVMVPVALFDLFWKRHRHAVDQRMSLKDMRDEHRSQEGDPMLKQKRMQIARARLRRPLAQSVPEAALILTNPTHYAVALRYTRGVDVAPVCVAKGTDIVAAKIREIGHAHDIPVLENRALARALYASVEIDEMIPEEHWPLVADLIGYVISLKNNVHRPAPLDTVLRDD